MALTLTLVRSENGPYGKMAVLDVVFDNSYPTGGEPLDLTATPFTGVNTFTSIYNVNVNGPHTTDATPLVPGAITGTNGAVHVRYLPAASYAPATGTLVAYHFSAADATGVYQQFTNTGDLSGLRVRCTIWGA